jgi:hypothetical protein
VRREQVGEFGAFLAVVRAEDESRSSVEGQGSEDSKKEDV